MQQPIVKQSTLLKIKAERMQGRRDRQRLLELKKLIYPINRMLSQIKEEEKVGDEDITNQLNNL